MSRSVRSSIRRVSVMSVAIRPEHISSDQEALLDLLVGALEAPVLVLDDAVAGIAGPIELAVNDAPVDLAETGDPGDLPAHPHRQDPVLVEPVAVDHQILG